MRRRRIDVRLSNRWIAPAIGLAVLLLFGTALVVALHGEDAAFRIAMGTGALNLASYVVGYYFGSSHDRLASRGSDPEAR